jgi:outer membrane protein
MLYTNPVHDYTEFVLEELGLASEDRNQAAVKGSVKSVSVPKTPVGDDQPTENDKAGAAPATRQNRQPATRPATRKN